MGRVHGENEHCRETFATSVKTWSGSVNRRFENETNSPVDRGVPGGSTRFWRELSGRVAGQGEKWRVERNVPRVEMAFYWDAAEKGDESSDQGGRAGVDSDDYVDRNDRSNLGKAKRQAAGRHA